ncbi:MAG TPA: RdgB/HAM1 family non-canonical purine NTP pyrophosphatase [Bacteroidales bacterium]|nr:RdgB/HAM1 family non-canonical purine NTP pyrophosphatase [Bacteroidales bacterium]
MDGLFRASTFFELLMEIIFATNNRHKLKEVQQLLGHNFNLLSLSDVGIIEDIPEDFFTLQENALQKASVVYQQTGKNCFADDTGLEIVALNGQPGVLSARYAGKEKNSEDNIQKVLRLLKGVPHREAQFRTVIALIYQEKEYLFESVVKGEILYKKQGNAGFGYDPIFKPLGFKESFAQMDINLKNKISHRGKATAKLVNFLLEQESQ